ncbi:hypothetical protein Tco_0730695 [Tanacetum coccineum]
MNDLKGCLLASNIREEKEGENNFVCVCFLEGGKDKDERMNIAPSPPYVKCSEVVKCREVVKCSEIVNDSEVVKCSEVVK